MSDIDIKNKVDMLLRYGFKLNPGELFKNKSGSIILQRAPSSAPVNNIAVMLDGISVGHYSTSTGKFVYGGGKELIKAFPPSRIQSCFSDLLRRHLDKDQEEFGHSGLPEKLINLDYGYAGFYADLRTLDLLGLFLVDKHEWDLGYFSIKVHPNKTIEVNRTANKELLIVYGQDTFEVYSNRISSEIISGIQFYLLEKLRDYWISSGYINEEPKKWSWDDQIQGTRTLSLTWLAWYICVRAKYTYVTDRIEWVIKHGMGEVCCDLEKEHDVKGDSYNFHHIAGRQFYVYQNIPSVVY